MMWILWGSDNRALYEKTLSVLGRLAPTWDSGGTLKHGEPYYSCPIRFVYAPEDRDRFDQHAAYNLVLVDQSDVSRLGNSNTPVASLSEVQGRFADPRALFNFLFEKGKQTNNSGDRPQRPRKCRGGMDVQKLAVGQTVLVNGGFGPIEGKIIKIDPSCVYVETANGRLRFNYHGQECGPDGVEYTYPFDAMQGPGPWELL